MSTGKHTYTYLNPHTVHVGTRSKEYVHVSALVKKKEQINRSAELLQAGKPVKKLSASQY